MSEYSFSSSLDLLGIAKRTDDASTDTSRAPFVRQYTRSVSTDVFIYSQLAIGVEESRKDIDLQAINDGLGDGPKVLTNVFALCISNAVGIRSAYFYGNFFGAVGLGELPAIQIGSFMYWEFPNGESVTSIKKVITIWTGVGADSLVDLYISGSTL